MAGADQWPDRHLLVTALDTETGEQQVFDRASGAPLPRAVAASTAFPGVCPPITVNGRRYMDGSLRSATNAALAAAEAHTVVTIEPDPESIRAFGPDLNDRTAWEPAYRAGLRQTTDAAD
nr:patatin-like phospholipase family protein [Kitasatospora sp. SID7827]